MLYFLSNFNELKLANIFDNMKITRYSAYNTNMLKIIKSESGSEDIEDITRWREDTNFMLKPLLTYRLLEEN